MNFRNKISCLKAIIKVKFLSRKIPLVVSWHILNRCNLSCKYCYRWGMSSEEISTQGALFLIDELADMGTQAIIFSGGEPLLRDDIGQIVKYCRSKNIFTGITSNGLLVPSKIKEIKNANLLKLSFDGPPEIHNLIRGSGAYGAVMDAVRVAKEYSLKATFNTTLTKYNLSSIDFILQKAQELNIKVKFQPLSYVHTGGHDISSLMPEEEKYKDAIRKLINLKRSDKHIINSLYALNYLYHWPKHDKKLECYGGRLICCISPDGNLSPCTNLMERIKTVNYRDTSFKHTFNNLVIASCDGCWCTSTLELNCLLAFKIDTIFNISKLFI